MIEKLHNLTETSPIKSPTLFPTKTFLNSKFIEKTKRSC